MPLSSHRPPMDAAALFARLERIPTEKPAGTEDPAGAEELPAGGPAGGGGDDDRPAAARPAQPTGAATALLPSRRPLVRVLVDRSGFVPAEDAELRAAVGVFTDAVSAILLRRAAGAHAQQPADDGALDPWLDHYGSWRVDHSPVDEDGEAAARPALEGEPVKRPTVLGEVESRGSALPMAALGGAAVAPPAAAPAAAAAAAAAAVPVSPSNPPAGKRHRSSAATPGGSAATPGGSAARRPRTSGANGPDRYHWKQKDYKPGHLSTALREAL